MEKNTSGSLKALGVFMILFALVYAIVGTLALVGAIEGALPGHENQEILLAVLGYVVAFLSLLCGIACVKGISGLAKGLGFLFAVAGLASLIYLQVTQDAFSIFDCLAVCFGVSIMFFASKK